MRKTVFIILAFTFVVSSLSAKKRDKRPEIKTDSVEMILQTDSVQSEFLFPMILVGDLSFSGDSVQEKLDADSVNLSNKNLYKKQIVDFLVQNVVYPNELREEEAEDFLKVRFDLDKDGRVKNPQVFNSIYPEMEKEVLRVLNQLSDNPSITRSDKSRSKKKNKQQTETTIEVPISFKVLKL